MLKKRHVFLILITVIIYISGCSNFKKCDHNWKEATCTESKSCIICGITSGDPLGHSWKNAVCNAPQTCVNCKMTKGKPIEHCYIDGNCIICNKIDLRNTDLDEFGFVNSNGMTLWMKFNGYSLLEKNVYCREQYFTFLSIEENEFIIYTVDIDNLKSISGLTLDYFKKTIRNEKHESVKCDYISNNYMKINSFENVKLTTKLIGEETFVLNLTHNIPFSDIGGLYAPVELLDYSSVYQEKSSNDSDRIYIKFK